MATRHVLGDLTVAAHGAGLPRLDVESVGGVDAAKRIAAGEPFDLVFLADGALAKLAAAGHVEVSTVTPLMLSPVAIAVPSGCGEQSGGPQLPAFADAAQVRAALRAASRVGYSTGPSGTALVNMIDEWGMTGEVGDRLVQASPGIPVAKLLAEGQVDLGFQQLSELTRQPGVRVLGVMPDECAIVTVFSGAIASASGEKATAALALRFFASEAAAPIKAQHAFGDPALTTGYGIRARRSRYDRP
ncbi:substrate-binding domain-containing protein [Microbacterium sp. NPDC058342]|uniref:substrate-binding domain-containing protein n=1 Tax=Microbacterium sp. NPDC058342 TaxID=3346454 RepID=UPI0036615010